MSTGPRFPSTEVSFLPYAVAGLLLAGFCACGTDGSDMARPADAGPSDEGRADANLPDANGPDARIEPDASIEPDAAVPPSLIGGTLTGLVGDQVELNLNVLDSLILTSNGPFQFPSELAFGTPYSVFVSGHPGAPTQYCSVHFGQGTVVGTDVDSVEVNCDSEINLVVHAFGVSGTGLTLANIDGQSLAIAGDGRWEFSSPIAEGAAFDVTIDAQPTGPDQHCVVYGGAGTASYPHDIDNIVVDCGISELERVALLARDPSTNTSALRLLRIFPGGIAPSPEPDIKASLPGPLSFYRAFFARFGDTLIDTDNGEYLDESSIGQGSTSTLQLEGPAERPQEATLSADGAYLLYQYVTSGTPLVARSLESATSAPIAFFPASEMAGTVRFGVTHDGGAWAVRAQFSDAFSREVYYLPRAAEGWGTPIAISPNPSYWSESPVLSEDGRWIAFEDRATTNSNRSIYVVNLENATPAPAIRVHGPAGGLIRELTLSPNGRWIACRVGNSLYAADLAAANPLMTVVAGGEDTSPTHLRFSPVDGRLFYFQFGSSTSNQPLYYVDLEQSTPAAIVSTGRSSQWNASGTKFMFTQLGTTSPILVDDFSGTIAPVNLPVGSLVAVLNPEFHGDSIIASASTQIMARDQLVLWDLSTSPIRAPAVLTPPLGTGLIISTPSRFYTAGTWFYTACLDGSSNGCELWRRDAQTGETRRVPWFGVDVRRVLDRQALVP